MPAEAAVVVLVGICIKVNTSQAAAMSQPLVVVVDYAAVVQIQHLMALLQLAAEMVDIQLVMDHETLVVLVVLVEGAQDTLVMDPVVLARLGKDMQAARRLVLHQWERVAVVRLKLVKIPRPLIREMVAMVLRPTFLAL